METRTHTPVRPPWAERARTVLAAAASASVHWDGGRVDLLGCHQDTPHGGVILTLEAGSCLVRAAASAPQGDLPVVLELTELCPVNARHRVRSRVSLGGWLSLRPAEIAARAWHGGDAGDGDGELPATLHLDVAEVVFEQDDERASIGLSEYRAASPDPLYPVAAEQLQHLDAHHPDAIALLSRLCDRTVLLGATRVLPIALDRFGLMLRIERLRGHTDVRLGFREPVSTGAGAVAEMNHLFGTAMRHRPCASLKR